MTHPPQSELLLCALQPPSDREAQETAHHVNQCHSCRETVARIREVAGVLQSSGVPAAETEDCLDEMTVAMVAEQSVEMSDHPAIIAHLADCAKCREQVASVAHLLRNESVAAEIGIVDASNAAPVTRRGLRFAGAGALTAIAAAAVFMVGGFRDRASETQPRIAMVGAQPHREPSMTTTVAPSLIAPLGAIAADTFRWTSVPRADRYRLTVFDREGKAVWEVEGTDTAVARPDSIAGKRGTAYLWKVEARTGWDRWVASELVEFSAAPAGRIP